MRRALALVASLLLASVAHAASPEWCGNGIDDPLQTGGAANGTKGSCPAGYIDAVIGNGCDLKCPGADADGDGYTSDGTLGDAGSTDKDCDDNDRRVFPGIYVPDSWSSPTGYRYCQSDGTYTSTVLNATTPLCEATGSGVCKYVDCSGGSNSNSGTYASPYLTIGKVSGGSGGSPPASPFTLTAGSVAYLLGSGTCSTTFISSTGLVTVGEFNSDGTVGDKIRIKRYPGATATISNSDGPGFMMFGDNYVVEDLDITTNRSTSANAFAIWADHLANIRFSRLYIHDVEGHGDNNDACLYMSHTNGTTVDHSYFEDCRRSTGNVENIRAVSWLDDDLTATECQNHYAKFTTIWWTTYDNIDGGDCFGVKHGCLDADVGANNWPIQFNTCINARRGIMWNGSALRASDNNFYGVPDVLRIFLEGELTAMEDNQFTYNTMIDSSRIGWYEPYYLGGTERLTVSNNVMKDNKGSYSAGNDEGVIMIDPYGSDSQKTTFEAGPFLTSNSNCFYNPNTGVMFAYFGQSGGIGHGPAGAAGGHYTFAQWKSNTGQDASSFEENPNFNSYQVATSTNCSGKGRRYVGGGGGGTSQGSGGRKRPGRGRFQ